MAKIYFMELLSKIGQFVLMISILVILHEFGHYIPAKIFKTKIEKFFLFFDVKFALFKKKIGETTWGIGWLPLGGYVKIAGMIDESMDRDQMAKPPQPWEFRSKPAWQRLIIMCGGVIVNFLLGWFVLSGLLFTYGETYIPTNLLKNGIEVDSVGKVIGLKTGDKILSIDGKPVKRLMEASVEILLGDQASIEREGRQITLNFTAEHKKLMLQKQSQIVMPRIESILDTVLPNSIAASIGLQKGDLITHANNKNTLLWKDLVTEITSHKNDTLQLKILRNGLALQKMAVLDQNGKLGIGPSFTNLYVTDNYTFLESIPAGLHKAIWTLSFQIRQFKLFFNKKTEAYKEMHGPVGIVQQMPSKWNTTRFWSQLAMFSLWLGFVNILPIPALDGGHVMFLLYEIVSGKKPSQKVLEIGQIIGFVLTMGLMLFITVFNDIL